MENIELGEVQLCFAEIVWKNAPIASGELVKICAKELNWKKPTTYTVLRKLCEKGLFENVNGTVEVRVSKEEYYSTKTEHFLNETFGGSLPAFISAFASRRSLSPEEVKELSELIENYRAGGQ